MKILFYHTENKGETPLVSALVQGMKVHGEDCDLLPFEEYREYETVQTDRILQADVVFIERSILYEKTVMETCATLGKDFVYYDKGYFHRGWKTDDPDVYYRFSVNDFHPLEYFQSIPRPSDRWLKLNIPIEERRSDGNHVVFAGCSWKFARWHGFDITDYASRVIGEIKKHTNRPVVYRPKVSSRKPPPIPGTIYSYDERKIHEDLKGAHALVTFSSNVAVDAILAGVPAFVLGPGIARPMSNADLSKLDAPGFPTDKERLQWAYDLAYSQWRISEMQNGVVWQHLKEVITRKSPHAR